MPILTFDGVRKSYGIRPLLADVSFVLEADEKVGVIGVNGAGKTTLLRIAAGAEPPDGGRVIVHGATRIGYLPQRPEFDPEQTVIDAVFAGEGEAMQLLRDYEHAVHRMEHHPEDMALVERVTDLSHRLDAANAWGLEVEARAILDRLGLTDTEALVGTLSGGQKKRVALARALVEKPDLLILDEPTNHLDAETVDWLEAALRRFSGALLLVTHDRYFLDRVTNRMLDVEGGDVQRFVGNYTAYLEQKEAQAIVREAESGKRANLARRELAWLRRGAKARTTKQKARVDRAHTLLDTPKEEAAREIELTGLSSRLGKKVVELHHVSKRYDGPLLVDDFSYLLTRNDRIGVIGPNGSGKTTLLEIITGRLAPDSGHVERGPTVAIGYYDQESRALADDLRVIDYIQEVAEHVKTADGTFITASQMLERFLFTPAQQYTPVGLLSGGERRRLYMLRILMGAPNVLLLDEPTNDLDIPTLVALEEYLEGFPGCLIVVSHDRAFLDRTAEHLFRFEGDGKIRDIPGNYSAWLEIQARETAAAREAPRSSSKPAAAPTPVAAPAPPPSGRKLSHKEKRELEETEARIAATEARQAEIEGEMVTQGADFARVAALSEELGRLTQQLERDMNRWAELAELA
ncbi:MAG TPA: ABC-F family ATP-binding cassette domain-containing protein [Rhodothermales bacterium]|nr:ABC-F family ATP-binding cassette domain-containing protein [Rhodothermales bacterium]